MHIITGEIRKEPRIKQTQNGTLYVVELSERVRLPMMAIAKLTF